MKRLLPFLLLIPLTGCWSQGYAEDALRRTQQVIADQTGQTDIAMRMGLRLAEGLEIDNRTLRAKLAARDAAIAGKLDVAAVDGILDQMKASNVRTSVQAAHFRDQIQFLSNQAEKLKALTNVLGIYVYGRKGVIGQIADLVKPNSNMPITTTQPTTQPIGAL